MLPPGKRALTKVASYNYDNYRVVKRAGPLKDYCAIHYMLSDRESIKKRKHDLLRVQSLSAPVGPNGADQTVVTFDYHHTYRDYSWTDATDANGNLTRYHFTPYPQHQLNLIEHFDQDTPIYNEVFTSDRCYQTGRYLTTPDGTALSARTCEYDQVGNVIQETLWGDFTGTQAGYLHVEPIYSQGSKRKTPKVKITPIGAPEKIVVTYTYSNDGFNNLLSEVCENKKILYTYLPDTDLIETKKTYINDLLQEEEHFAYNFCGQLTCHTRSDTHRMHTEEIVYENGLPVILIDPFKTIHRTYSKRCLPIEETLSSDPFHYTKTTTYDGAGRPLTHTDFLGQKTSTTYDTAGHPILHITPTARTTIRYSEVGLPLEKTQADDTISLTARTTYDSLGNAIIETDPNGQSIHTTYNFRGQPVTQTDPLGYTTTYAYDSLGNCIATTDPLGHTTYTTCNARGDPIHIVYPDQREERFTYSLEGYLLSRTDPTDLTTYTRDYRGRPLNNYHLKQANDPCL